MLTFHESIALFVSFASSKALGYSQRNVGYVGRFKEDGDLCPELNVFIVK